MRGDALRLLLWLAASILLLARPLPACAQPTIADTGDFVIDKAAVVDAPTRTRLEGWLKELQRKTTAQVKILTVPSLGEEDVVTFAQRHYEAWKLGKKGKDNGALIVLSLQPHRIRIHTGYGLEGALPDSWCGTLSREIALRFFKGNQFSAGLEQLTAAVVNKVADEYQVAVIGVPAVRHQPQGNFSPGGLICALVFLAIVLPALLALASYSSQRRGLNRWGGRRGPPIWGPAWYDMLPRGGSTWSGGGGGFGGFGGGFGGGGGSFGGGGSSGGGGGGASW